MTAALTSTTWSTDIDPIKTTNVRVSKVNGHSMGCVANLDISLGVIFQDFECIDGFEKSQA